MSNRSLLQDIVARERTDVRVIGQTQWKSTKFVDDQNVECVPKRTHPFYPTEETGHAGQVDEKTAEDHHDRKDEIQYDLGLR